MTTFAVLATGPSMSQAVADSVRHLRRIAVSNAYQLAPDAEALVAIDSDWWDVHPDALKFAGRRFSANPHLRNVEYLNVDRSWNSGLLGIHVAIHRFKASRVELYGFDMTADRGQHYFGKYENGLANTTEKRFEVFKRQFAAYEVPEGVFVVNRTPGSALKVFPFEDVCEPVS